MWIRYLKQATITKTRLRLVVANSLVNLMARRQRLALNDGQNLQIHRSLGWRRLSCLLEAWLCNNQPSKHASMHGLELLFQLPYCGVQNASRRSLWRHRADTRESDLEWPKSCNLKSRFHSSMHRTICNADLPSAHSIWLELLVFAAAWHRTYANARTNLATCPNPWGQSLLCS